MWIAALFIAVGFASGFAIDKGVITDGFADALIALGIVAIWLSVTLFNQEH